MNWVLLYQADAEGQGGQCRELVCQRSTLLPGNLKVQELRKKIKERPSMPEMQQLALQVTTGCKSPAKPKSMSRRAVRAASAEAVRESIVRGQRHRCD